MKAINRYIIVDKIKTEPKKVAGLIMTDDTDVDNRYIKAEIISCGNLVEGLKDGDTIYYDKHAGHDISWKDTLYRVIRDGDVVIVDRIKTEPKKVAGLIMTDDTDVDNRYIKAKIISCGNLVEGLKDGDTIYYDKHAGHDISWKDTLYRVIRDGDVVLVD